MKPVPISSRMILGTTISDATRATLVPGVPQAGEVDFVEFCVFEVTVDGDKVVYCCWAGGDITADGQIMMSPVGSAATEALANLPMGSNESLTICQLRIGPTPLQDKILDQLRGAKPGAKLCFLGDLAGELDGKMSPAFNYANNEPLVHRQAGGTGGQGMTDIIDKAAAKRLRVQLADNPAALNLLAHVEELMAQVQQWRANHADMVARAALLMQRPDLPVDRLPAYREMERLQSENAALKDDRTLFKHGYEIASNNCVRLEGKVIRLEAVYGAVQALIAVKGRFHTEQNYGALVRAADACAKAAP